MDMYDEQGNPVTDYDPAKGRLEMQKRIHHHEAVEAVEEQGHWEIVAEYPETGGKDVQWVVEVPGVEAREAWDEEETYWLYIPYTKEELKQMEEAKNRPSAEELLSALMEGIECIQATDHSPEEYAQAWKKYEGTDDGESGEVGTEEWPEFKKPSSADDAYYAGAKITFEGKHYICIAPAGYPCTYSPIEFPTYWELQG